ncbi:ABC transporter ATP-binding protein [Ureibacillus terrenus]|uniref:ABC transporter ATP-binding protein n=1 Tax=Ureibacillus terrenus TaxID=118246 RepID=UPI002E21242A|nr:ABC transporter ATP-binding protein [Ureibacillus terrenus]
MNIVYKFRDETNEEIEKIKSNFLLEVNHLSLTIERVGKGSDVEHLHVIRDFHLNIHQGEVVAIVGASGSGKSLLADAILGIHPKNSLIEGNIKYENQPLTEKRKKRLRGNDILLIPQMTNALDPLMKAGKQVESFIKQKNKQKIVKDIFQKVGLDPAVYHQIPSTLSGGMIRRIFIAMALASKAKLIIADEPTNGLDAEALDELLFQLKMLANDNRGIVMITHDLEAAMKIADKIAVFYAGETVEIADRKNVRKAGKFRHPYSRALWNALPQNGFVPIECSQPSPAEEIIGCSFASYCPEATKRCGTEKPELREVGNGEMVRCFYA